MLHTLRIGLLLGLRQIQRANIWTTILIIFVMMLTFLNLVAVSGILVGLIEGAEGAVRKSALGDVVLTPLDTEDRILTTPAVLANLSAYPEIRAYSVRYSGNAVIEANYKTRRDLSGERDTAAMVIKGIDPIQEDQMTSLTSLVVEGEYLDDTQEGYILIGAYYLKKYAEKFGDSFDSIDAGVGDTVRMTIGNVSKEFVIKGIIESKVDEVNLSAYIPEREFRRLFNRLDRNADQIVLRLYEPKENIALVTKLRQTELVNKAKIKTFEEGLPKFLIDVKKTFQMLGLLIGSIGIVVASITIFIIIFINALSRRRHIGILKGIGIERRVIEIAYVLQASFYALSGSALGALITYGYLVPHFLNNPIQFPFSDGILTAEPLSTFLKFVALFIITLIAGFIPAWMIARQNTLDSILGRQ